MKLVYHTCPKCAHFPVAAQAGGQAVCQRCRERLDDSGRSLLERERQMIAAYAAGAN